MLGDIRVSYTNLSITGVNVTLNSAYVSSGFFDCKKYGHVVFIKYYLKLTSNVSNLYTGYTIGTGAPAAHGIEQWSPPCIIDGMSADGFISIATDGTVTLGTRHQNLQNATISGGFSYICV